MSKAKMKTAYLYQDGHAVVVFEQRHARSGKEVEWVEIFEKFHNGYIQTHGAATEDVGNIRLILTRGLIPLVMKSKGLEIYFNNSTSNAKDKGLTIRSLTVYLKDGDFTIYDVPGLITGDFTLQAPSISPFEVKYPKFEDHAAMHTWGFDHKPVAKVHRVEKAPVA